MNLTHVRKYLWIIFSVLATMRGTEERRGTDPSWVQSHGASKLWMKGETDTEPMNV